MKIVKMLVARVVVLVVCTLVVAFVFCSKDNTAPVNEPPKVINWPRDSIDWVDRLDCPKANGYLVLLSTTDFHLRERYYNVTYVLERGGRYWIGRRIDSLSITSDPPVRAWSIDTSCCGCAPK